MFMADWSVCCEGEKACCQDSCVHCRPICSRRYNSSNSVVDTSAPWPSWCVVGLLRVSDDDSGVSSIDGTITDREKSKRSERNCAVAICPPQTPNGLPKH